MRLHQNRGASLGRDIYSAHPQTKRTPHRVVQPNNPWNSEPVVWYESPFADAEWMPRSTAEQLLKQELPRWERLGAQGKPPRIVERDDHVQQLSERVREIVQHEPAPRSARDRARGVTRCQRCGSILVKDSRSGYRQPLLCQPLP